MDVPSTSISDEDALSDELRKMALVREMKETMERLQVYHFLFALLIDRISYRFKPFLL